MDSRATVLQLLEQGQVSEAEDLVCDLLKKQPQDPEALSLMAEIAWRCGYPDEALDWLERAIQQTPRQLYFFRLLEIMAAQGDSAKAAGVFGFLLDHAQATPAADHRLAVMAMELQQPTAALKFFERSLATEQAAEILIDYAQALQFLCHYPESLAAAEQAVRALSTSERAGHMYAGALEKAHRLEEALSAYRKALTFSPQNSELHYNLGCCLLLAGDFAAGWPAHESRLHKAEYQRYGPISRWTGQPRQGRALLVSAEQGFGDSLQFSRYLAMLQPNDGPVYFACQPELAQLMADSFAHVQVLKPGDELSEIGWQVALMSLPAIFGTQLESVPAELPYLRPKPDPKPLPSKLNTTDFKVGLVWSSGRHAGLAGYAHQGKSVPLTELQQAFAGLDGVRVFSLQTGSEQQEAASWPELCDLSSQLTDFGRTAGLMQEMDLILSVDTASAHLAGALGLPIWTLLPYTPNWRWMLDRDGSPWYPQMRLFRQDRPRDWRAALQAVRAQLLSLLNGPQSPT